MGFRPSPTSRRCATAGHAVVVARREHLTRSQMLKLSRLPIYQGMSIRSPGTTRRLYELMLQAETASAGVAGGDGDPRRRTPHASAPRIHARP